MTDAERFWSYVNKNGPTPKNRPDLGPCWLWKLVPDGMGYGRFVANGKTYRAHRYSLLLSGKKLLLGKVSDHLCVTKLCVNDGHVEQVTQKVNVLRGQAPTSKNARKTHCCNGHEFTADNTMERTRPGGGRICRTCLAIRNRSPKCGTKIPYRRASK
jgi:hypothetical protein